MSLNINYHSDGSNESMARKSSNNFSKTENFSIKKVKGNLDFHYDKTSGVFYATIHDPYLSVLVNDKPWVEVTQLSPEATVNSALYYIRLLGKELAEKMISDDSNSCLWWNIIYHLGSFDAVVTG